MTTGQAQVITVDGPSGTGKGTLSRLLAEQLGWHMLDSGALYRVVAVGAAAAGIDQSDEQALSDFAYQMDVAFSPGEPESILLDGEDITDLVRLESSGEKASRVASLGALREALLARQRDFRVPPGLVADGRDMGTVVFPNAPLKIFLTASAEERSKRRYKQLKNKGVYVSLPGLLQDIRSRDERDSQRRVAPLVPAEDAVVIDTTTLSIDEVLKRVLNEVEKRLPELQSQR